MHVIIIIIIIIINSCTFSLTLWISNQAAQITPKQQKHPMHSNIPIYNIGPTECTFFSPRNPNFS